MTKLYWWEDDSSEETNKTDYSKNKPSVVFDKNNIILKEKSLEQIVRENKQSGKFQIDFQDILDVIDKKKPIINLN